MGAGSQGPGPIADRVEGDVPLGVSLIHCVCRLSAVPPTLARRLSEEFEGALCLKITIGAPQGTGGSRAAAASPLLLLESSNLLAPGGGPLVFNLRSSCSDCGLPACWTIANGRPCFAPAPAPDRERDGGCMAGAHVCLPALAPLPASHPPGGQGLPLAALTLSVTDRKILTARPLAALRELAAEVGADPEGELRSFSGTMLRMLGGAAGEPAGPAASDADDNWLDGYSSGGSSYERVPWEEQGADDGGGAGSAASARPAPRSWAQLTFPQPLERRFCAWQQAAMWKFDLVSYIILIAGHSINCFSPTSPIALASKTRVLWILGYMPAVPALVITLSPTRPWYIVNRERLVQAMWLWVLLYMHFGLRNHLNYADPAHFRNPLFFHGFGWLPVMGLLLQLRLAQQAPIMAACYLLNITHYPEVCTLVAPGQQARCVARGAVRVLGLGVLLPLLLLHMLEMRARRLFLASHRRE